MPKSKPCRTNPPRAARANRDALLDSYAKVIDWLDKSSAEHGLPESIDRRSCQ
jgi:hypothetical protein